MDLSALRTLESAKYGWENGFGSKRHMPGNAGTNFAAEWAVSADAGAHRR